MCLAVPAQVEEIDGHKGRAALAGNRINVLLDLVPEVRKGDWVLIHAGFAIAVLDPDEAKATYDLFAQMGAVGERPGP